MQSRGRQIILKKSLTVEIQVLEQRVFSLHSVEHRNFTLDFSNYPIFQTEFRSPGTLEISGLHCIFTDKEIRLAVLNSGFN